MSTVILHSIEWSNCFSFGNNNKVEFDAAPVSQIIGPNGYGKSSIPLILEEGLYNKNSKGVKKADIPNRILDEPYDITVNFSVDVNLYRVEVKRSGSTVKVALFENDEDISSHTATATFKEVQELLGIDFKIFQQLVYQSTNSSLQFLSATDTARKKFLIDLFDLSGYTELFEVFKTAVKDLSSETNKLEGQVDTIQRWIEENDSLDLERKEYYEIPERPDFSEEIGTLSGKIQNAESRNSRIQKNETLKKELQQIEIDELKEKIKEIEELSYDELQAKLGEDLANKKAAEALVSKIKKLEDQCPTCLQKVDPEFKDDLLDEHQDIVVRCDESIESLQAEIESIKENNMLFKKISREIKEYENLEKQIDWDLQNSLIDVSKVEEELKDIKFTIKTIDDEIAAAQMKNAAAEKHNSRIDIFYEQNEERTKELEIIKDKLDVLSGKLQKLEVLKQAFGTNGLVAYKLENLVKDLEEYANEYLADLSDGRFTIEFAIVKDKLNVVLTDEGKEINISSPSSGEMARINISTLLAIRKLMSDISKNTLNVLFLDEVISVLDDYGREKLVEVLLEENLNTFLVSHSWTHPLVDKLEVKKDKNGISWIDHG